MHFFGKIPFKRRNKDKKPERPAFGNGADKSKGPERPVGNSDNNHQSDKGGKGKETAGCHAFGRKKPDKGSKDPETAAALSPSNVGMVDKSIITIDINYYRSEFYVQNSSMYYGTKIEISKHDSIQKLKETIGDTLVKKMAPELLHLRYKGERLGIGSGRAGDDETLAEAGLKCRSLVDVFHQYSLVLHDQAEEIRGRSCRLVVPEASAPEGSSVSQAPPIPIVLVHSST